MLRLLVVFRSLFSFFVVFSFSVSVAVAPLLAGPRHLPPPRLPHYSVRRRVMVNTLRRAEEEELLVVISLCHSGHRFVVVSSSFRLVVDEFGLLLQVRAFGCVQLAGPRHLPPPHLPHYSVRRRVMANTLRRGRAALGHFAVSSWSSFRRRFVVVLVLLLFDS